MLKLQWKRTIIAGAVLTAFCANAFAAEPPAPPKPSMKDRVNAILNEDNNVCPPGGPLRDGARRAPKPPKAPEYLKHHHHGITKEAWDSMTPEQRHELHEKWRQEWEAKTPEERRELRDKWHKERLERMTPEQRQRYEERRAEAERLRNLSPEERREEVRKLHEKRDAERQERAKEKMEKLSPEQRAEVEAFLKEDMEKREQMRERMENMTPEQRDAIRAGRGPAPKYFHGGHHGYRHHRQDREHCWY